MQVKLQADGAVAQVGNSPPPHVAGVWKDVEPGVAFVGIVNRSVVLTVTLKALEHRRCCMQSRLTRLQSTCRRPYLML